MIRIDEANHNKLQHAIGSFANPEKTIPALRALQDALRREDTRPAPFSMPSWGEIDTLAYLRSIDERTPRASCTTAACLAGSAVLLNGYRLCLAGSVVNRGRTTFGVLKTAKEIAAKFAFWGSTPVTDPEQYLRTELETISTNFCTKDGKTAVGIDTTSNQILGLTEMQGSLLYSPSSTLWNAVAGCDETKNRDVPHAIQVIDLFIEYATGVR